VSLRNFFASLATDQNRLDAYKENPDSVMKDAGVSDDDRALVLSGDLSAITAKVESEPGTEMLIVVVVVVRP
jgi:hypothetical protein